MKKNQGGWWGACLADCFFIVPYRFLSGYFALILQAGNASIAFLVHVSMALSNEWWSLWWMS